MKSFRRNLLAWYDRSARDLPWRGAGRTPYRVLVSEIMLQQTQVAAVVPFFERFMARLPALADLADADEQTVLRLWQGLGYYSRARNLHRAVKAIMAQHGGEVPRGVAQLLELPGIGRYTAGAIASIAHDVRAPIVDGNVSRVLCRVEGIEADPRRPDVAARLWERAGKLVPRERPGDFNSALMELGATICTPRSPRCPDCPVRRACKARAAGAQDRIPAARARKALPLVERDIYRVRNGGGEFLIEQRPPTGRWAGLWQFPTRERGSNPPVEGQAAQIGTIAHTLTHRRYAFRVFGVRSEAPAPSPARWVAGERLDEYPMPRPHLLVREMADAAEGSA